MIRGYERLFLDKHVWGRENIPPGSKIIAINHITSYDGFHIPSVFSEPLHTLIGPGFHSPLSARLLYAFEHINVLQAHRKTAVEKATMYLKKGESVFIAPEGDIQEPFQLGRFYPGVAKIYCQYPVPIIPVAIVAPRSSLREYPRRSTIVEGRVYRLVLLKRGPYCVNIGEPWMPECPPNSDADPISVITQGLKERIEALVQDVRQNKFWL